MNEVIKNIQNNYLFLSPSHKLIAQYILSNPDILTDISARELAEKTFCVPSSIISFCKKLGYKGFNEIKFYYNLSNNKQSLLKSPLIEMEKKIDSIEQTKLFEQTIKSLDQAPRIFIFAFGMSQIPAMDFYMRMAKIEPSKMIFYESYNEQYRAVSMISPNDVAVLISNSGEAKELIFLQKYILKKQCKQILVTNKERSTLSHHVDIEICLGFIETDPLMFKELPTLSRFALMHMLDRIFLVVFQRDRKNKEENMNKFLLRKQILK